MRTYRCQACGQAIYFENIECLGCGRALGYLPEGQVMSALEPAGDGLWRALATGAGRYRMCIHYSRDGVCNWMVPEGDPDWFCRSCRLNETIPDLGKPGNRRLWLRLEAAKRRLVYSLQRMDLPHRSRQEDPEHGLGFAFLADPEPSFTETMKVMTGHARGLITINIAEADDAVREQQRLAMNEPYRTVLGHFRHESGHYYWERLVRGTGWAGGFRSIFGDERQDYDRALAAYYRDGAPGDWQQRFVSAYASAHPWEDWAETWAHFLHMVDTIESARAFGIHLRDAPPAFDPGDQDGYVPPDFEGMLSRWFSLTAALNSINRSMGYSDLYPFALSAPAIQKLRFLHRVVCAGPR